MRHKTADFRPRAISTIATPIREVGGAFSQILPHMMGMISLFGYLRDLERLSASSVCLLCLI